MRRHTWTHVANASATESRFDEGSSESGSGSRKGEYETMNARIREAVLSASSTKLLVIYPTYFLVRHTAQSMAVL